MNLEGFARKRTNVSLGGRDFTFSELSLADLASFRAWVCEKQDKIKARRKEQLLTAAKQIAGIEPKQLLELLKEPLTDEDAGDKMNNIEDTGYLSYLSLKYVYPEITPEQAMGMIGLRDIQTITQALLLFEETDEKKELTAGP